MRLGVVFAFVAGAATALAILLVSEAAARCIDTPVYYNLWPLLSASLGVAAIVGGSLPRRAPTAVRIVLVMAGVLLVAGGVAVASFKACAQFSI
jgi:hypothetical protein